MPVILALCEGGGRRIKNSRSFYSYNEMELSDPKRDFPEGDMLGEDLDTGTEMSFTFFSPLSSDTNNNLRNHFHLSMHGSLVKL